MDKRFAIFDMDGTIVDSMGYWQNLGREYLTNEGIVDGITEILEEIKPMTVTEASTLFIKRCGLPGPAKKIAEEMYDIMDKHYCHDVFLKPNVREYLEKLHNSGVTMCIASATPEKLVDICLRRLGVKQYFTFLLSCETVGAGKRYPNVFIEAARRLGAEPKDIAVYEDAIYAAQTAKSIGFYTVGVYDTCGKNQWEQMTASVSEIITDWHEASLTL